MKGEEPWGESEYSGGAMLGNAVRGEAPAPPAAAPQSQDSAAAGSTYCDDDYEKLLEECVQASEAGAKLTEDDTLLIVSFEAPLKVTRKFDPDTRDRVKEPLKESDYFVEHTHQMVVPGLHKLRYKLKAQVKFVGYVGISTDDEQEQRVIANLLEVFDTYPVFPDNPTVFRQYNEFCFKHLSPCLHSLISLYKDLEEEFDPQLWAAYQKMNYRWADVAMRHMSGEELFWVHDHHLLLVPRYITRRFKSANIGLFLHTPFPSCDIFRCLPVREEILRGMLCADLVGFHFFEYLRHFLLSCKRLLGIDHRFTMGGYMSLDYLGRQVMVRIGHVNVEYQSVLKALTENAEIVNHANHITSRHEGKFIFGSVDRCDHLAGLTLKLKALRRFLEDFAYARHHVCLVQYAYPPRSAGHRAQHFGSHLKELADSINSQFGQGHVELHLKPVAPAEKWALLSVTNALLDTSIKDGLNLTAYEYMACRNRKASSVILSEFVGCSATLASAVRINPWDVGDVAAQMDVAVRTQGSCLAQKWERDQSYLSQNSLETWARDFLVDLKRAKKVSRRVYMQCGFGNNVRMLSMDDSFRPLDIERTVVSYNQCTQRKRLFFFDHEGTLAPDRRALATVPGGTQDLTATGSPPSQDVRRHLATLAADPNNLVFIFSGRDRRLLDQWFGGIPNLGLCAEHGYFMKSQLFPDNEWHCLSEHRDLSWKRMALGLMHQYAKRTQGSIIEHKGSAIVFQYRGADPDLGSWQAKELATHLEDIMFKMPVSIKSGKGYVECRLSGVSKGVTVEWILSRVKDVGYILCIGDDSSDEEMFEAIEHIFNGSRTTTGGAAEATAAAAAAALRANLGGASLDGTASLSSGGVAGLGAAAAHPLAGFKGPLSVPGTLGTATTTTAPGTGQWEGLEARRADAATAAAPFQYYTVTVGKRPSAARSYVNDTDEVLQILSALTKAKRRTEHMPRPDLDTDDILSPQGGSSMQFTDDDGGDASAQIGGLSGSSSQQQLINPPLITDISYLLSQW